MVRIFGIFVIICLVCTFKQIWCIRKGDSTTRQKDTFSRFFWGFQVSQAGNQKNHRNSKKWSARYCDTRQ